MLADTDWTLQGHVMENSSITLFPLTVNEGGNQSVRAASVKVKSRAKTREFLTFLEEAPLQSITTTSVKEVLDEKVLQKD